MEEKTLKKVQELIDIQATDGNWDYDEYTRGILNGMICIQSVLTDKDPIYKVPKVEKEVPNDLRGLMGKVINSFGRENKSNTPDFILAEYLVGCLEAFEKTSNQREQWYGKKLGICGTTEIK